MNRRLIAVTRAGVREADIFRFWLEYYRPHVDGFHILLVREEGDDITLLEDLCRRAGAPWTVYECTRFVSPESMEALRAAVEAGAPCDWLLHADSDEFLRDMPGIRPLIARMEEAGADHYRARMVDRLTPEGRLRSLNDVNSLEELYGAFPVEADITRKVAVGGYFKRCLARWPAVCIHLMEPPLKKLSAEHGRLDHFKWRTGLRDRLTKRFVDYTLARIPWVNESARLMDELHVHGRFRVEDHPVSA